MKNKLIPLFAFTAFLFNLSPIFAQTQTVDSVNGERHRVTIEQRVEVRSTGVQIREEKREEKREEIKTKLSDFKQKKFQIFYEAIKNGLSKRHQALLKIKDKIQARIDKNPMNKDLTQAKAELVKFTAAEAKYQADLITLDNKFNELKNSTDTSNIVKNLKSSVDLVREDLNAIKKILTNTVKAMAQAPKLIITPTN